MYATNKPHIFLAKIARIKEYILKDCVISILYKNGLIKRYTIKTKQDVVKLQEFFKLGVSNSDILLMSIYKKQDIFNNIKA